MTGAGWIVAALLALCGGSAFFWRDSLLRRLGYRLTPLHAPSEKPRNGAPEQKVEAPRTDGGKARAMQELAELEVSDVMVHRTNMRSLNADLPTEVIIREALQSPDTRLPLWRGTSGNIVGVLHAKELLSGLIEVDNDITRLDIAKVAAKPWFVPDTTPLSDQINAFIRRKAQMAIVVDEYGEVEGIVTLEDIIEEIVGEIVDERDVDLPGVRKEADGSIVVEGNVPIRDLNRALGWDLPDEEATTIAGLVIHETQSIPDERQAFTFLGKRFIVMKRDKNRIARLRIRPAVEIVAAGGRPA